MPWLTLFLNCIPACWFETSLQNFEANISAAKTWNILNFRFNFSNSMIGEDYFSRNTIRKVRKLSMDDWKLKYVCNETLIIINFEKGITQCNELFKPHSIYDYSKLPHNLRRYKENMTLDWFLLVSASPTFPAKWNLNETSFHSIITNTELIITSAVKYLPWDEDAWIIPARLCYPRNVWFDQTDLITSRFWS